MNDIKNLIKEQAARLEPIVVNHRRELHRYPELSELEFRTTEYIKSVLSKLDIEFHTPLPTGVIAIIGSGEECVALRADIDALPITEETGLEFASKVEGVMHACGHDIHTAVLLGTAEILKSLEQYIIHRVMLIFQPSEEKLPGGASKIVETEIFKQHNPKFVFGQHINPEGLIGTIAVADGPVMASTDELYWALKGKGSHAAQPHLGNDPILSAANIIQHFQSLIVKSKNPLQPGVLSITAINGGNTTNIFPETVSMKGTLRSFDEGWRNSMKTKIREHSIAICSMNGVECDVNIVEGYPALVNNKTATDIVSSLSGEMIGENRVEAFEPKMWAEDFAYYSLAVPSAFWFLGVKRNAGDETIPLHNPRLNPSEDALRIGMELMAYIAMKC